MCADGVLLHAREAAASAHAAHAAHGAEPAIQAQVLQDVARGGPAAARARAQDGRGAADAQDPPGVREDAEGRGAARLQPAQPVRYLRRLLHAHLQVRSITLLLHYKRVLYEYILVSLLYEYVCILF